MFYSTHLKVYNSILWCFFLLPKINFEYQIFNFFLRNTEINSKKNPSKTYLLDETNFSITFYLHFFIHIQLYIESVCLYQNFYKRNNYLNKK